MNEAARAVRTFDTHISIGRGGVTLWTVAGLSVPVACCRGVGAEGSHQHAQELSAALSVFIFSCAVKRSTYLYLFDVDYCLGYCRGSSLMPHMLCPVAKGFRQDARHASDYLNELCLCC
jgi:hypothetical protein